MSKVAKCKYLAREIEDLSVPMESQSIVRIMESRGNNLHEVEDPSGNQYLVSMPPKFRRNIWVKRGDYVLVEPIAEGEKVKAEIVRILTREHKKRYREQKCWPKEFDETPNPTVTDAEEEPDLFVNTNRLAYNCNKVDNDSDTSSDESDSG